MSRWTKVIAGLSAAIAVLAASSAWLFLREFNAEKEENELFEQQMELYSQIRPQEEIKLLETTASDENSVELNGVENSDSAELTAAESNGYLDACQAVNSQTTAWLMIPDTDIDFPVVQSEDNSYYLTHNLENNESVYGVPFLDYRCSSDFSDFNSVIYGHNIEGERMFAQLLHFQEDDFFQQHDIGYLITNQQVFTVHWFSCLVVKNDAFVYDTVFLTDAQKTNFINNVKQQAVQYRQVDVNLLEKRLVTLSTCSFVFQEARTVVIGYLES